MTTQNIGTLYVLWVKALLFIAYIALLSYTTLHPLQPMINGNTETFHVSSTKKRTKRCKLEADTYSVIKIEDLTLREHYFNFHAITGTTFTKLESDHYENEIGYALCNPGWIQMVYVEPKARDCGLATVLTELCLIDPDINQNTDENTVYRKIDKRLERNDEVREMEEHLRTSCSNLMGLEMTVTPFKGAYAYFSAAMRMKYQYMAVQPYDAELGHCGQKFKYYQVDQAQQHFDENTGRIEDGKGDTEGTGRKAQWYFCKYRQFWQRWYSSF